MGFSYMGIGSLNYLIEAVALRRAMRVGKLATAYMVIQSVTGFAVWMLSTACFLEHTPSWMNALVYNYREWMPARVVDNLKRTAFGEALAKRKKDLYHELASLSSPTVDTGSRTERQKAILEEIEQIDVLMLRAPHRSAPSNQLEKIVGNTGDSKT